MPLNYNDYSTYYASRCSRCQGKKRVLIGTVWTSCSCQHLATIKHRFEQVNIEPKGLKYLNWSDFNGSLKTISPNGRVEITGCIEGLNESASARVAFKARSQAMRYCFDSDSLDVVSSKQDRQKHSLIHERLTNGGNVVIAGGRRSGKSLLAVLILKEIVRSCVDSGQIYTFGWVHMTHLIDAAHGFGKFVDFDKLEEWAELDFLFIDNFGPSNAKVADLDKLICDRRYGHRPTIVTCNSEFLAGCKKPRMGSMTPGRVVQMMGPEALEFMLDPSNVEINLSEG